jgi:CHAT domain-containing protein
MFADLALDLVVLSACETGAGRTALGGYIEGLASAFLSGGARTVIGACWPVHDRAGAVFVERLYDSIFRPEVVSVGRAVTLAQRAVQDQEALRHPYFWAPFVAYRGT